MATLNDLADLASLVTAAVAGLAVGKHYWDKCARRRKLESYLVGQKLGSQDKGQRSLIHLVAALSMTEAQLLEAAFSSKKIRIRRKSDDDSGLATTLLFEMHP